jgi:tetratricopeptide (TPR) repeat protein
MRAKASVGIVLLAASALAQNADPRAGKKTQLDPEVLKRPGKYFALVIGNNEYASLPKLETAVKDAQDVSNVLRTLYSFEVKFLANATRAEIMSGLSEYRRTLTDADNLLIYYAGHGERDRGADRAYWLPVDAEKDNNANWISADDVTGDLRAMPSRHILVISDSCYSGGFRSAGTEISPADVSQFLLQKKAKRSRTLMSSGALEPVSDGGGAVNSVFAEALIQGLSGTDEQAFSAGRFFDDFVEVRVAGKARQTPLYSPIQNSGDEGGDFVFIRAPKPSPAGSSANSALDSHNRGSLFIADGKWAEAEAEYKMAVSLEPNNALYHSRLGDALYSERKYAESEKEFREAVRLDPTSGLYKNALGNLLWSQERWQESEKLYHEALALTPNNPWIYYNLAGALIRRGDAADAEPLAKKAADLAPSEAEIRGRYGATLRTLGRPEAIAELTKAVQLNPKLSTYWNELGLAQQVTDLENALSSYKKASELVPNNAVFRTNVAFALFNLKRYPEAEAEAKEAVRVDEKYAEGHYWLGRALYAEDKGRDAERPLRQAVVLNPADDKHNWLGNDLDSQGRWDEAVLEYKEAIRLNPRVGAYYANLANTLFKAKRPAEAEASYKQAIAIAPNDAELQRHYGVFLFNQDHFEDAKAVFEPIRAQEPANALNWANSGNTMIRLKDFSTGEKLLRRAVELDKTIGWYFVALGDALEGQEKFADALQAYLEAQKLAPSTSNSESVDRVRARLTAQPAKP